jgi:hypothetical protein
MCHMHLCIVIVFHNETVECFNGMVHVLKSVNIARDGGHLDNVWKVHS